MKIELHEESLKESLEVIEDCIQNGMIIKRQKTIGFHCSSASIDMFEIFLHKLKVLEPTAYLKHNLFSSEKKAEEKLYFQFPHKDLIVPVLIRIEKLRNLLCYGKPKPEKTIEEDIQLLKKLQEILGREGVKDGEK